MSMKMVCNRCNKVKKDGESFDRIRYICSEPELLNEEYDLCPECSKLFSMFLDGGTVEEDHYKDSKPCAIVIHKLANGLYGIENAPEEKEDSKYNCYTCGMMYHDDNDALRCGHYSGGLCREVFANGDKSCPFWERMVEEDHEEPDTVFVTGESIDKEESDLSVETHTNAAGVTVPDSEPWRLPENRCATCKFIFRKSNLEPCKSCEFYSNWKSKLGEGGAGKS